MISDPLYVYRQNEAGTMWQNMKQADTLFDHAKVQQMVWRFMKGTEFFHTFYEEIKLYFLHTCFYETLYFAKLRNMKISMEQYRQLEEMALKEVLDPGQSVYETLIPQQMKLYRLAEKGMGEEELSAYMDQLPTG